MTPKCRHIVWLDECFSYLLFSLKNTTHFPLASFVMVVVMMPGLIVVSASYIFIFGDLCVDIGKNNHITMLAKAKFWFNGINIANGFPVGKFFNSRTVLDFLYIKHIFLPLFLESSTMKFHLYNLSNNYLFILAATQTMVVSPLIPYLDNQANGTNLHGGVNFASGGSGILPSTGYKYVSRVDYLCNSFLSTTKHCRCKKSHTFNKYQYWFAYW